MYYRCEETIEVDTHFNPKHTYAIIFCLTKEELQKTMDQLGLPNDDKELNEQSKNSFITTFDDHYKIHIHKSSASTIYLYENCLLVYTADVSIENSYILKCSKLYKGFFDPGFLLLYFEMVLTNEHQEITYLEERILALEQSVLQHKFHQINERFLETRKSLLYQINKLDQITSIFEELSENELNIFEERTILAFENYKNRYDRYGDSIHVLSEYLSEVITIYQSEVSIQQNEVMKLFTVLTAIFLPPTLLVGWYGMNFEFMPELHSPLGYPLIVLLMVFMIGGSLWFMKKKNYF